MIKMKRKNCKKEKDFECLLDLEKINSWSKIGFVSKTFQFQSPEFKKILKI